MRNRDNNCNNNTNNDNNKNNDKQTKITIRQVTTAPTTITSRPELELLPITMNTMSEKSNTARSTYQRNVQAPVHPVEEERM